MYDLYTEDLTDYRTSVLEAREKGKRAIGEGEFQKRDWPIKVLGSLEEGREREGERERAEEELLDPSTRFVLFCFASLRFVFVFGEGAGRWELTRLTFLLLLLLLLGVDCGAVFYRAFMAMEAKMREKQKEKKKKWEKEEGGGF